MATHALDFSIRIASTFADLAEACKVRAQSYGHHLPELVERFAESEALDHEAGTVVLLARDKRSGAGIGTARIRCSALGPLQLEASAALPAALATQTRAEITRLAVSGGADPRVKLCLMKACYLFCVASQVRWLVIGARSEALIRNYRRLGFADVLAPGVRVPLAHAGGLPHLLLAFDVTAAERTWLAAGHRLYEFMVASFHPDLQLFDAAPLPRALPRRLTRALRRRPGYGAAWPRPPQRASIPASSSRV